MEVSTEAFIGWIKVQKQEIGQDRSRCCFPHGIILPEAFGKVWLFDDDCVAISPAQYREFVVPYNAKVFREFGGGTLISAAAPSTRSRIWPPPKASWASTTSAWATSGKSIACRRPWPAGLPSRCATSTLHIEPYYEELFAGLRRRGTIVGSFVSPELALNKGKYGSFPGKGRKSGAGVRLPAPSLQQKIRLDLFCLGSLDDIVAQE